MKHIGVVGVTVPGALLCIETIVALSYQHFGSDSMNHPCFTYVNPPLIESEHWYVNKDRDSIGKYIVGLIDSLVGSGVDFIIIPSNSPHYAMSYIKETLNNHQSRSGVQSLLFHTKVYFVVQDSVSSGNTGQQTSHDLIDYNEFGENREVLQCFLKQHAKLPVMSIVDLVIQECQNKGYQKIGILGVSATMSDGLYEYPLRDHGFDVCLLSGEDQQALNDLIYNDIIKSLPTQFTRDRMLIYVQKLQEMGCDSFVAGCTEIPLVLDDACPLPYIDTTRLLAQKAFEFTII